MFLGRESEMMDQSDQVRQTTIKFSKKKRWTGTKKSYDKVRINVFRTASGFEYDLRELSIPSTKTGITSTCSTISESPKTLKAKDISNDGSQQSFSDEFSLYKEKQTVFEAVADDEMDVEDFDDECDTLYSHASVIDLDLDDMEEDEMLDPPGELYRKRPSFKRSFHTSLVKVDKQDSKTVHKQRQPSRKKLAERKRTRTLSLPKAISLYEKVVRGLTKLFQDDQVARLNTLQYLTDISRRNSGASILSITEREILGKLLYTILDNNSYRESTIDEDGEFSPWRSSSFNDANITVSDEVLSSVLLADPQSSKGLENGETGHLSAAEDMSLNLGFAGAFLVTIGALAKLNCTPLRRRFDGFIKIKCKQPRIKFGVALIGQSPCRVRFQRPGLFSLFKMNRYFSILEDFTRITQQFMDYVHQA